MRESAAPAGFAGYFPGGEMDGSPAEGALEPIILESLSANTILPFDLYLYLENKKDFALFRNCDLPFKDEHRKRLIDNKIDRLYIDSSDRKKYRMYVEENLDCLLADDAVEKSKKAAIVYSAATTIMQEVLKNPPSSENIRRSGALAENIVSFILQADDALRILLALTPCDYYIYTHSVNVCAIGVSLGQRLEIADRAALCEFAVGALLHDIGKSCIDPDLLSKKGPLSQEEWQIIKKHPRTGYEMLRDEAGIPDASGIVIIQHHEKLDGSGYPYGLKEHQIHPFAKVVCEINIFDALTTKRTYRDAVSRESALDIMKTQMSRQIDRDVFKNLLLILKEAV